MMPFIYLQMRLACTSDSISSLDYCCAWTLSWTNHQENQLKSPSVSLPFCPLSLPAALLHFTFESHFDHVDLSIKSYTKKNDSYHPMQEQLSSGWKASQLFILSYFICLQIWIPMDQEMDGEQFLFWSTRLMSRFMQMYFHHTLWIAGKKTLHKY